MIIALSLWGPEVKKWHAQIDRQLRQAPDGQFPRVEIMNAEVAAATPAKLQSMKGTTINVLQNVEVNVQPNSDKIETNFLRLSGAEAGKGLESGQNHFYSANALRRGSSLRVPDRERICCSVRAWTGHC